MTLKHLYKYKHIFFNSTDWLNWNWMPPIQLLDVNYKQSAVCFLYKNQVSYLLQILFPRDLWDCCL